MDNFQRKVNIIDALGTSINTRLTVREKKPRLSLPAPFSLSFVLIPLVYI